MSCNDNTTETTDPCATGVGQQAGNTIAEAMLAIGPRTIEGDQGRVSMHGIHDVIAAMEYDRKRSSLKSKACTRRVLLTISNHRLATHDGPAS